MGEHRTKKWKRIMASLLAVMLMLITGGSVTGWYAGEEKKTVRLTLPRLEGCGYDFSETEYVQKEEEGGAAVLLCSPGREIRLTVTGERTLGNLRLETEGGELYASFEGRDLSFEMPDQDLYLRADLLTDESPESGEGPAGEETVNPAEEETPGPGESQTEGQTPDPEENRTEAETSGLGGEQTEDTTGETLTESEKESQEPEETEKETETWTEEMEESGSETLDGSETSDGSEPEETETGESEPGETGTEEAVAEEPETAETEPEETEQELRLMRLAAAADSVTLNSGDFYYAPAGLRSGEACTVYKTVTFQSGGEKVTKIAFCMQPYASGPDDGHVYEEDDISQLGDGTAKNRNIMKALFYLYSGPAWGKIVGYADGSGSVNLKELMEAAGCTGTGHYYCISHYVISYFYLGAGGNWNSARLEEGTVTNVFNDKGVELITRLAEEIKKLPMPVTTLSASVVTAVMDYQRGTYRSQSLTYQAPEGNTGTVSLPQGITLVNETSGETKTGTAQLQGGDQFYLQAAAGSRSGTETYTIKTSYAVDFAAYKLEFAGRQDVGFACEAGGTQLSFSVNWPAGGTLTFQKVDSETGASLAYNGHYSLAGAVYGVYTDAGCSSQAGQLKVGSDGTAEIFLTVGTYYLKEIQAPKGYEKDSQVHQVSVGESGGNCKVAETPVKERIRIRKKDSQTGQAKPQNSQCTFAGAEYTIYRDASCTDAVQVLVTDSSGEALSGELRLGDYYIKETKAPEGYLMDTAVYPVTLTQEDAVEVYDVSSAEQVIRGSLALVKYLDDSMEESILQDLYDSGKLEHIRFILRHEDPQVPQVTIETDRYGYAATERQGLVYGTWYLTEDPATTPDGYEGIKDVPVEIREEGTEQIYVVTNKPYQAYLCIRKLDAATGTVITSGQAEFQILDGEGKAVQMPTFDGYTDTFRTNEKGEIHLTKSLKGGSYTLVETKAPEGYECAEPLPFRISGNAVFEEPLTLVCRDEPQMGRIEIIKTDRDTKERCQEGFTFEITVAEDILDGSGALRTMEIDGEETELRAGTVVDRVTTDEEGTAQSCELYLGTYEVREVQPGQYYASTEEVFQAVLEPGAEEGIILCSLSVENEMTALEIEKTDGQSGACLAGVSFRLWEKEGQEEPSGVLETAPEDATEDAWKSDGEDDTQKETEGMEEAGDSGDEAAGEPGDGTEEAGDSGDEAAGEPGDGTETAQAGSERFAVTDENGRIRFDHLKQNTVYCLQETETLPGYVLDPEIYEIQVDSFGRIQGQAVWGMKLSNVPNLLEISKQDITGGGELPGAQLILQNEAGEELERWISGDEPHLIRGLSAGRYQLTEITAPQGYEVAESITFELTDSYEIQQVTMYDRPLEPETEPETEPQPPQTEPETTAEPEIETETEPETETETETETQTPETDKETPAGSVPKTGDDTPLWGMIFVALCALVLMTGELLRRLLSHLKK